MTSSLILDFIKVASRVPTGDNCQPFYFKIVEENNSFEIWHNPEIAKHQLNPKNLSSLISFGAMVELLIWYSKSLNASLTIQTHLQHETIHSTVDSCWGVIKISNASLNTSEINSQVWRVLNNIKTYRKKFSKKSFEIDSILKQIQKMESEQNSLDFAIHFRETVSELTADHIASNDASIWKKQSVLKDIMKFAYLRKSTQEKLGIGFHWTELGMRFHESILIPMVWSPYSYLLKPIFSTLIFSIAKSVAKRNIKSSSGFLLFSGNLDSLENFFKLGKAITRLRIVCADHDLCGQPFSIATFPLLMGKFSKERSFLSTENLQTQMILKTEFQVPEEKQALWFFRVGPLPQITIPTIRRPLKHLIVHRGKS